GALVGAGAVREGEDLVVAAEGGVALAAGVVGHALAEAAEDDEGRAGGARLAELLEAVQEGERLAVLPPDHGAAGEVVERLLGGGGVVALGAGVVAAEDGAEDAVGLVEVAEGGVEAAFEGVEERVAGVVVAEPVHVAPRGVVVPLVDVLEEGELVGGLGLEVGAALERELEEVPAPVPVAAGEEGQERAEAGVLLAEGGGVVVVDPPAELEVGVGGVAAGDVEDVV